jgi:hypothetical protein
VRRIVFDPDRRNDWPRVIWERRIAETFPKMKLQLLLSAILMVLLPSCCSPMLAEANRIYRSDMTEIRDDARAEGYLVTRKGGKETFRFRGLLHEKDAARIVEITVPQNHRINGSADLREVDHPFQPGNKPLHSLRVIQNKEAFNFHFRKSVDSRQWIIGKRDDGPRLFMAPKGEEFANHLLHMDLKMVHRSKSVAALRNLGYVGTVPCDVVTFPLLFGFFSGLIPQ